MRITTILLWIFGLLTIFFFFFFFTVVVDERVTGSGNHKKQNCVARGEKAETLTDVQLDCLGEPYGPLIREVQEADPVADAKREAGEGDFRLLRITGAWSGPAEPGTACALDVPEALIRGSLFFIDVIYGEGDISYRAALQKYATAYNRAIVTSSAYPYPDICTGRSDSDKSRRTYRKVDDIIREPLRSGQPNTLHIAARSGDAGAIDRLKANGSKLNEIDAWGFTPVGWSVLTRHSDVLSRLIAAHADPNLHGANRPTPLNLAINARSLSLVRLLTVAGASLNESSATLQPFNQSQEAQLGGTPLWVATKLGEQEIVRHLLASGADPNHRIRDEQTPIFAAIESKRLDLLRMLIEQRADVRLRDSEGIAPILSAAGDQFPEGVRLVASAGGLADARSKAERELWRVALNSGREEILMNLVAFGANANLLKASERELLRRHIADNRNADVLEVLVRAHERETSLIAAIQQGNLRAIESVYSDGAEIAEGRKRTELIVAVQSRRPDVVRWFLDRGADPLAPMYPVNLDKLRNAGASSGSESPLDREGTAVSFAFQFGPIESVRLVLARARGVSKEKLPPLWGSRLHRALFGFRQHKDPSIIEQAVELAEDFPRTGPQADKFLREVCFWTVDPGTSVLEAWLRKGYRPRQMSDPPQRAAHYPGDDLAFNECLEQDANAALLMLAHGADPNQLSSVGRSPLGDAIDKLFLDPEYLPVIKELLKRGANPNQPNEYGGVVLDVVRGRLQGGDEEQRLHFAAAEKLLVSYGAKTRAQLEKEGVIKPMPEPEQSIPIR
jgi:ankyrin repeat protein